MKQTKAILINDLSGFGRCSISVELPILSVLKIECLLLPTALLSAHTAYPDYILKDLSEDLMPWARHWKSQQVLPDAIFTGYLANGDQVEKVCAVIDLFKDDHPFVAVDPVMADDGKLYHGLKPDHIKALKPLLERADLITPNLSEAALLCGWNPEQDFQKQDVEQMGEDLARRYSCSVVIKGLKTEDLIQDCLVEDGRISWIEARRLSGSRPGTGDVFFAVLCGSYLNGKTLEASIKAAGAFVRKGLQAAETFEVPVNEGIPFEEILGDLIQPDEN